MLRVLAVGLLACVASGTAVTKARRVDPPVGAYVVRALCREALRREALRRKTLHRETVSRYVVSSYVSSR